MESIATRRFLAPIRASTMTAEFKLEGLELDLEDFLGIPLTGQIVEINSTLGKNINPEFVKPEPVAQKRRGRKKKVKTSERCKGGSFGSQIQAVVRSRTIPNKVYKIKCFTTGSCQVPGVLDPYYEDVMPAINELRQFISNIVGGGEFPVVGIRPVMRNYVTCVIDDDFIIELRSFTNFITKYKGDQTEHKEFEKVLASWISPDIARQIMSHVPINRMRISRIQYDPQKYGGVKLGVFRPVHGANNLKESEKILTIKVLQSGKINFDGNRYIWENHCVYEWLNYLFCRYGEKHFLTRKSVIQSYSQAAPVLNLSEFLPDGTPRPVIYIN